MNMNMMNSRTFPVLSFIGISILLSVISCDLSIPKKEDLASWTTKLEVPMFEKTITFEDIIDDSLINPLEGSSLYAFTKNIDIDRVEVGDKLEIEDIQKEFSQNVDDVTVDDSHIQERIGFKDIGVSPINQTITSVIGTIVLSDFPEKETDPYLFSSIFPDINGFPNGTHPIPEFDLDRLQRLAAVVRPDQLKPLLWGGFQAAAFELLASSLPSREKLHSWRQANSALNDNRVRSDPAASALIDSLKRELTAPPWCSFFQDLVCCGLHLTGGLETWARATRALSEVGTISPALLDWAVLRSIAVRFEDNAET